MNQNEIFRAGTTALRQRLVVVDYSTIPAQQAEADMIRRELARRVGCGS